LNGVCWYYVAISYRMLGGRRKEEGGRRKEEEMRGGKEEGRRGGKERKVPSLTCQGEPQGLVGR
jgi:hypothetical protein